jgi:cation diffusion facilitator CzcD-associated flavoprotein CzcO
MTERGCVGSDGVEHALDVLICATGFDVSFTPRFPVVGPAGDLRDAWGHDPKSYLGTAAANVPNYMLFLGPNCPVGNGPVLSVIGKFLLPTLIPILR